ncbi:hypothetical protein QPX96_06145 [Limosilactobacillus fermentum]|nr:hypothetical protein [Limosilactobacillus fermentum]
MKVNQFSLIQTDDATRRHELKALHLLMDGDEKLSASQLLLALLCEPTWKPPVTPAGPPG